jgi:hypothetical protein
MNKIAFLFLVSLFFQMNSSFACGPLDPKEKVLDFSLSQWVGHTCILVVLEDSFSTDYSFSNPPNSSATLSAIEDCAYGGHNIRVQYYTDCSTGKLVILGYWCTDDPID